MIGPKRYETSISLTEDGALHIHAKRSDGFVANKRFTPSAALAIREWLTSSGTDWERDPRPNQSGQEVEVEYSHDTGYIVVNPGAHPKSYYAPKSFDPNSDEALAKFVRYLKSRAPRPNASEPDLPDLLPQPTADQLAKATRYVHAMPANGYVGQASKRKTSKSGRTVASLAKSRERLAELRKQLIAGVS